MSNPHSPSLCVQGSPPIPCDITAIIPIMAQFVSPYPCNNPQPTWVIWGYAAAALHMLGQISEQSDISLGVCFPPNQKIIWRNQMKVIPVSHSGHMQWLNSYPWTSVTVVCTFIDWVAFCHDIQKANICYREKKKHTDKCWTNTVDRTWMPTMRDVILVIGIFCLQQAFNKHALLQCCLQLLSVCIDVICANKSILLYPLASLFLSLTVMKKCCALVGD